MTRVENRSALQLAALALLQWLREEADKIVFVSVLLMIASGLYVELRYWTDRATVAEHKLSGSEGQVTACLSGTMRLIWADGSVTVTVPARHYEGMLTKEDMRKL